MRIWSGCFVQSVVEASSIESWTCLRQDLEFDIWNGQVVCRRTYAPVLPCWVCMDTRDEIRINKQMGYILGPASQYAV